MRSPLELGKGVFTENVEKPEIVQKKISKNVFEIFSQSFLNSSVNRTVPKKRKLAIYSRRTLYSCWKSKGGTSVEKLQKSHMLPKKIRKETRWPPLYFRKHEKLWFSPRLLLLRSRQPKL